MWSPKLSVSDGLGWYTWSESVVATNPAETGPKPRMASGFVETDEREQCGA